MSRADKVAERARGRPPLPGYRKDQRLPQGSNRVPTNEGLMKKGGVNTKAFQKGGAKLPNALYGSPDPNPSGIRNGNLPDVLYGRGRPNPQGLKSGALPDAVFGRSTGIVTHQGIQHGELPSTIYGGKGNLRRKK